MNSPNSSNSALRIDVAGYTHAKWRVRAKRRLLGGLQWAFDRLSGAKINPLTGETLAEEGSKLTSKSLKYAEATLDKPSIENQHKIAEIEKAFDERKKIRAETLKTDAETQHIKAQTEAQWIDNVKARLDLFEKLDAFEKRTGKKIAATILGEVDEEMIAIPGSLIPFLEHTVSQAAMQESDERIYPPSL